MIISTIHEHEFFSFLSPSPHLRSSSQRFP